MIKAVAFDFVGVFVRENNFELTPIQQLMERKFGILNTDKEFIDCCVKETKLTPEEIENEARFIISHIYEVKEPKIFSILPKLKFSTATNHLSYLDDWLKTLEIAGYFDFFVNSALIGFEKPSSDFYQTLIETIGEKSTEILFVDDNYENCLGAEKCGLKVVHLQRGMVLSTEVLKTIQAN